MYQKKTYSEITEKITNITKITFNEKVNVSINIKIMFQAHKLHFGSPAIPFDSLCNIFLQLSSFCQFAISETANIWFGVWFWLWKICVAQLHGIMKNSLWFLHISVIYILVC